MTISRSLIQILTFIIATILLTGGFEIPLENGRIDLNQTDVFAIVMLAIFLLYSRRASAPTTFDRTVSWGIDDSTPKTALLFFGFVILLFAARCIRHWTLNTSMVDVTCVHQPLFYVFEPRLLHSNTNWNNSQLAGHMTWIFIPIGLLIGWAKSDFLIFVFKFVVVCSSIWFFVTKGPLARHRYVWFWTFFLIFASKALRGSLVWDFREDDVAFAAFLMAALSLYKGKMLWYWVSILIALACKENVPPIAAVLAIPILFDKDLPLSANQRRLHASATVIVSVVYAFLIFKFLIPHFMEGVEVKNNLVARFPGLGETTAEVVKNVLFRPDLAIKALGPNLFSLDSLKYLAVLLTPFIFFARYKLIWLVPAVPGILMNTLSAAGTQRMQIFHYELVILCFLVPAMVFGMKRWLDSQPTRSQFLRHFAIAILLGLCAFDKSPAFEIRSRLMEHGYRIPNAITLHDIQATEPLASTHNYLAHMSHLKELRLLILPAGPLPTNETEAVNDFIAWNPVRTMADEGRDPNDARFYLIDLESSWGRWMDEQITKRNLSSTPEMETPIFKLYKVEQSLFDVWCNELKICRS